MNKPLNKFSFPSYRRLCQYLGEADAMVELTELAARSFTSQAQASDDVGKFVQAVSRQFNVCVNLPEVSLLHTHLYRHFIVTVYQSAECFLHEFRREHSELYRKEWTGDANNTDPLTIALKNICGTETKAMEAVGQDLITRFHYYRSIRNWVVHTKDSDISKPFARYAELAQYSQFNRMRYASVSAPNQPDHLTFDDFVFFSRLTKDLAKSLCAVAMPPEGHWLTTFPSQYQTMASALAESGADEERHIRKIAN